MERLRRLLGRAREDAPALGYHAVPTDADQAESVGDSGSSSAGANADAAQLLPRPLDYAMCAMLGVSILWAWNMFLAATAYFQARFAADARLLPLFQPVFLAVTTVTSLGGLVALQRMQAQASYPTRIRVSQGIGIVVYTLIAASVVVAAAPAAYFAFFVAVAVAAAAASALLQNGAFAYVAALGRPEYMQALMTGQAVAGVLPAVAQVVAVLLAAEPGLNGGSGEPAAGSPYAASGYFFTAVVVTGATWLLFEAHARGDTATKPGEARKRRVTSELRLLSQLPWHIAAIFLTMTLTMFFPVFTGKIGSVQPAGANVLWQAVFVPAAFLAWNLGDLLGRLALVSPALQAVVAARPRWLAALAGARVLFIPLYLSCNLHGRGAVVSSDFFYLVVVQGGFGFSNGCIGAACFMSAGQHVQPDEREAAGSFMSLVLMAGLAVGSLLSFTAVGV